MSSYDQVRTETVGAKAADAGHAAQGRALPKALAAGVPSVLGSARQAGHGKAGSGVVGGRLAHLIRAERLARDIGELAVKANEMQEVSLVDHPRYADVLRGQDKKLAVMALEEIAEKYGRGQLSAVVVRAGQAGQVNNPEGHNQWTKDGEVRKSLVYHSPLRPVMSISSYLPKGWKLHGDVKDVATHRTFSVQKPLTSEEVNQWELQPDDPQHPVNLKKEYTKFHDEVMDKYADKGALTFHTPQGDLILSETINDEKYPFRITRFTKDGTPSGHSTFTDFSEVTRHLFGYRVSIVLQASSPKHGCLMAMVHGALENELAEWSKSNVPESALDPNEGRETEQHVTVLYGFDEDFDAARLMHMLRDRGEISFTLGEVSRFECPDYDVLKVDVSSPAIEKIHRDIAVVFKDDIVPSENLYTPHLTIAYLKKGELLNLDGDRTFAGRKVTVEEMLYSLPERKGRQTVSLQKVDARDSSDADVVMAAAGAWAQGHKFHGNQYRREGEFEQPKLPSEGTQAAIRLKGGTILPIGEEYPTHFHFLEAKKIHPEDVESGGFLRDGSYHSTGERSDTLRWKERKMAQLRLEEKYGEVQAASGAYAPGHQFHGNQHVRPEDFGMARMKGSLGRMGYHSSSDPSVRLSAQIHPEAVFITRLDAVEQGKGAGSKAIGRLKDFATKSGRRLELTAGADTKELQGRLNAFYEKHGFKKTDDAEHPSYVWHPEIQVANFRSYRDSVKAVEHEQVFDPISERESTLAHHRIIRDEARHAYQQAVNRAIATLELQAVADLKRKETDRAKKKRREEELDAIALLLFLAGERIYQSTSLKLASLLGQNATLTPLQAQPGTSLEGQPGATPTGEQAGTGGGGPLPAGAEETNTFAESRRPLLVNFPRESAERLDKVTEEGRAAGKDDKEVARDLEEKAQEIEDGQGSVVAETEATATLGLAQLHVLGRANFATCMWDQLDRPTKRDTHALNMEEGEVPVGHVFSNGQKCPGDAVGGAAENANCLCTLLGIKRKPGTGHLQENKP